MARMSRPKSPGSAPRKPKGPKILPHRGIEIIRYVKAPPEKAVDRRPITYWGTPVLQYGIPGVDYEYRLKSRRWHLSKKTAMAYIDRMMGD